MLVKNLDSLQNHLYFDQVTQKVIYNSWDFSVLRFTSSNLDNLSNSNKGRLLIYTALKIIKSYVV